MSKIFPNCAFLTVWPLLLPLSAAAEPGVDFTDATDEIDFVHRSLEFGGDGLAGAAWLDYDGDGDTDLLLANGRSQSNALMSNRGDGTFTDVTAAAGVGNGLGNSGVVAADLDNDGDQDLLLTGDGSVFQFPGEPAPQVRLYRNRGDGTFADATPASGLVGPETQVAVSLGDIDNDGDLDVFFVAPGSLGVPVQHRNRLFRNEGGLTFTDVSGPAGVDTALGACASSFTDYDGDGWIDLIVANCNDIFGRPTPFELFRNNGNGTFTDVAAQAGLDVPGYWMAVACGDVDNDGNIDFFATNLGDEASDPDGNVLIPGDHRAALFRNNGDGTFSEVAAAAGVDSGEFGWGAVLRDFDNDGWIDLFFAGSFPAPWGGFFSPSGAANPGVLAFNNGDSGAALSFTDASARLPRDLSQELTSGVAAADYDGDGFEDLVVVSSSVPFLTAEEGGAVLLRNGGNDHRSLQVELLGTVSNRDAVGARLAVRAGSLEQTREIAAGSGFASSNSRLQTVGLAHRHRAVVDVTWPLGHRNRLYNVWAGSRIRFPEMPCSFDEPDLPFGEFLSCTLDSLAASLAADLISESDALRFALSAIRAYFESR